MYEPCLHSDAEYQVVEFEGDDPQWLFELLNNPAFAKVPPSQLQGLFERFHPLEVSAGQVLVRQGDVGDYYYLIRRGRARVSRIGHGGREIVLADVGPGQGFGEEALISGEPRNATVTMLEPGLLMRLAADDFDALLRMPLVRGLDASAAQALLEQGAQLVDVRLEEEFRQASLAGAINVPLYLVRIKAAQLDRQRPVLLFCNDGRRSATAAFLLVQMGFETRILAAGLAEFRKTG
ncbi:MAG: cyclic nucleotide-binding domain-containing protein [Thiobacillus sp.]|nr:cyclic nucleotide-binding domain-containing protein [Thiobacillus sp.]